MRVSFPNRFVLPLALGGALLAALTGCGGSGGSSAPQPVATVPEGFWTGTLNDRNSGQSMPAVAIVLGSGESQVVVFTPDKARQLAFGLSDGRGGGLARSLEPYVGLANTATSEASLTVTSVTPKQAFKVAGTANGGAFNANFTYESAYDAPLTAADLNGSFTSTPLSGTGGNINSFNLNLTLTFDGLGGLTLTSPTLAGTTTLTGTYEVPDPSQSIFRVDLKVVENGRTRECSGLGARFPAQDGKPAQVLLSLSGSGMGFMGTFK